MEMLTKLLGWCLFKTLRTDKNTLPVLSGKT